MDKITSRRITMSGEIWLIGCTHFGHEAMYKFMRQNGEKVRPFSSASEGDTFMMEAWNSRVKPGDKVYVLGDVAFSSKDISILSNLHGSKILIKGNHDDMDASVYLKYFRDIRATHQLADEILSHIPLHPGSLYRHKKSKYWLNIHAHLHAEAVMEEGDGSPDDLMRPNTSEDPRYFSVCVERIGFAPISLDEVRQRAKERITPVAQLSPPDEKL
jgi:calcineurin-like phosphoesterase family protein